MIFNHQRVTLTFTDEEKTALGLAYIVIDKLYNYMDAENYQIVTDQDGVDYRWDNDIGLFHTFLENAIESEADEWEVQ